MSYISEKYQLGILLPYLRDQGFEYVTEGSMYGIPVDVIGYLSNEIYTFELKTKDFKRGLSQARRNTDYADYSYLVIWEHRLSKDIQDRTENQGIGLIAVDEDVTEVVEPSQNTPNTYAKEEAKKLVTNGV